MCGIFLLNSFKRIKCDETIAAKLVVRHGAIKENTAGFINKVAKNQSLIFPKEDANAQVKQSCHVYGISAIYFRNAW